MKKVLIITSLFFSSSFLNKLQAQINEQCFAIVDTVLLPKAIVKDSTLFLMLDSAINMLKIEPIKGNNVPYLLEFLATPKSITESSVTLYAANWYGYRNDVKDTRAMYKRYMLLTFKHYQILTPLDNSWLNKYVQSSNDIESYYIYGFFEDKNKKSRCYLNPMIRQEVLFDLYLNYKKPFAFDSYKYSIEDHSFFKDNELKEVPKNKQKATNKSRE